MKQEERLQHLFGDIDETFVTDADRPGRVVVRLWLPRIAAIAAAAVLTVGIALTQPWKQETPPIASDPTPDSSDTSQESTDTTENELGSEDTDNEPGTEDTDNGDVSLDVTDKNDTTSPLTTVGTETDHTTTKNDTRQTQTQKITGNSTKDTSTQKITTTTAGKTTKDTTTTTGHTQTTPNHEDSTTVTTDYVTTTKAEVAYVKRWDEKSIVEKYSRFEWNTTLFHYAVYEKPLAEDVIGDYITTITDTGYDIYTDTTHTATLHLYEVKDIVSNAAVAVRYEEDPVYYPAVNGDYIPATLGDMIRDLNMEQTVTLGKIYYTYRDEEFNFHDTTYSPLPQDELWQRLFFDPTLPNVYEDRMNFFDTIDISLQIPTLGVSYVLSVSEDGYLFTNLFQSGKAFYIGEQVAADFLAYVQENCTLESDRVVPYTPATTDEDTATTTSKGARPTTSVVYTTP